MCLEQCGANEFLKEDFTCHNCDDECDQCYGKDHVCVDCSIADLYQDEEDGRCKCINEHKEFVSSSDTC